MSPARSVLVVDDDAVFRERLGRALRERGYDVRLAADGVDAVSLALAESPEFAIVDLSMPEMDGLELVRKLHGIDASTRILMLTGFANIVSAVEAMRGGAVNYLSKPANVEQILAALHVEVEADAPEAEMPVGAVPSLARVEWEHIHRVLHDCGGNVSKAAKVLGIHRRSLQRKLAKDPGAR
ncbi:MAG: response regulator [Polyangiales bacterium]